LEDFQGLRTIFVGNNFLMKFKVLFFAANMLIFSILSCKKSNPVPPPASSGPTPTVYPCPAPNFTNVINPNGTRLIKQYVVSNGGNYKNTIIYYYDLTNRIVSRKGWDTINSNGWIYGCGEDQYVYGLNGKVDKWYHYSNGAAVPETTIEFFYNSVPQVTLEVKTYGMNYKDSTRYYYYPGRIERIYSNKHDIYYVNSSNNIDSSLTFSSGKTILHYDGKVNPLKDFYSRRYPYNEDANLSSVYDPLWGTTVVNSYTYNANNLPLVCNMSSPISNFNQITYYFYE
jgi:hypothetical protein